jgi:hypothetical protein
MLHVRIHICKHVQFVGPELWIPVFITSRCWVAWKNEMWTVNKQACKDYEIEFGIFSTVSVELFWRSKEFL